MQIQKVCLGGILGLSLSGCGAALEHWENQNNFMVSADDLDPSLVGTDALSNTANNTKTYVGLIVNDSELKCSKFLNGLVLAENTSNVGLDMSTTVLSALATAFTPLATIHALTAGATITSGWKTAIDSDIYAKATIANYAQAIQTTYYTDLATYTTALTNMDPTKVVASLESAKLRSIHKECSLAAAQSSVSAALQSPSPSPQQGSSATTTDTWTVSQSFKPGDKIAITATSATPPTLSKQITITVRKNETKAADVAEDLITAINSDADLQKANVIAKRGSDASQIVLSF